MDPVKKEPDQDETIFSDIDLKKERKKHINNAIFLLIGLAGLQLYSLLSNLRYFDGYFLLWQIFSIIFLTGMAFWAKYNPFAAFLVALIFWISAGTVEIATRPSYMGFSIMDIVVNGLVIVLLGLGIREAWTIRSKKSIK